MRGKWWSTILLLTLAAGCAHQAAAPSAIPQAEYALVKEQGALVVSIKPCYTSAECGKPFSFDPAKLGLLPVGLSVENRGDKPYIFSKTYAVILTSDGRRVAPLYFDQILLFTQELSKEGKVSQWKRLLGRNDEAQAIVSEVRRVEFPNAMILREQRFAGFLFFPGTKGKDTDRGGVLRILFRSPSSEEIVTFEFSLP
mgnify:CR=1 FL=1